jgi:hypothetical protein
MTTLSTAENSGSRWWNWYTKPMPKRRTRVRAASLSAVQLRPATNTSPALGASSSPAMCKSDDLPAPDGPTSAVTSPGRVEKFRS